MTTLRILHVEDSPTDSKLVLHELRRAGHDISAERVDEPAAMRAALAGGGWDVILCDWSMPRFSALDALAIVKELGLDVPFILVSGTVGEEVAVQAMRAGARDYVLKDRLTRLAPVVERELAEQAIREAARRSERARHAIQARFERLSESGLIGTLIGDDAGRICEVNDAFLAMVGYTREELDAGVLQWPVLSTPGSEATRDRQRREVLATGVAVPAAQNYLRKDGTEVPVLVGIARLDDERAITFMVDLTAQKRAEEALQRSEDQLRQSQKMDAIGRLAGGVAHDFNNLLSVILSYGEMAIDALPPDHAVRDDIEQIVAAGRRAADLTRQLLMFSRQEVAESRVLDLNDLLATMERMLRRIVGEDVELTSHPGPGVLRIRADPTHLEQVVLNLAINARDAMPRGGKLTIETLAVDLDDRFSRDHLGVAGGRYVLLAVTDTGVGMDRATQARIFEPFFTTKDKTKGTGLGLSTVFGIVQQCHGSIWVHSEPGRGSTFKVYLPRVDAAVEVVTQTRIPVILTGTETILLVEDDPQILSVASVILRELGYRVIAAAHPNEAMRLAALGAQIDLLLTDVVMPEISGPELARRLLTTRPALKVLCMSGYTDDALVRHDAAALGMAYLQKPITPDTLARKVRSVLDGPTTAEP